MPTEQMDPMSNIKDINAALESLKDLGAYKLQLLSQEERALLTAFHACSERDQNTIRYILELIDFPDNE